MTTATRFKTIANVLGLLLLIALVAPFVVYAVPAVVGAEYSFVVLTASMTPAIAPGDVVIVDERDPASIAEGDVITFLRGDNEVPVTHRVIGVESAGGGVAFETQGDANDVADASLVPGGNVLGVVMITIPYIGYVIQFAASPAGFVALVVIPFGLLAVSELWSLYRARTGHGAANGGDAEPAGADAEPDGDQVTDAGVAAGDTAAGGAAATGGATDVGAATDEGFVVTVRTVQGAVGVLLAVVPYAVYIAYTLRSSLTIGVATGATMGLLAGIVLLVTAGSGSEAASATTDEPGDGGDDPDDPDSDVAEVVAGDPTDVDGDSNTNVSAGTNTDADAGENAGAGSEPAADDSWPSESGLFDDPVIEPAADGGATNEAGR